MANFEIIDGTYKKFADGREICLTTGKDRTAKGVAEYRRRTLEMRLRQHGICCLLGKVKQCRGLMSIEETTFEHTRPKGMGSAFRDDRIVDEETGDPMNGAAHLICNGIKGSRRI